MVNYRGNMKMRHLLRYVIGVTLNFIKMKLFLRDCFRCEGGKVEEFL